MTTEPKQHDLATRIHLYKETVVYVAGYESLARKITRKNVRRIYEFSQI